MEDRPPIGDAGHRGDVGHIEANPITQIMWASVGALSITILPVMVLFRKKIGLRMLQAWKIMLATFLMLSVVFPALLSAFPSLVAIVYFHTYQIPYTQILDSLCIILIFAFAVIRAISLSKNEWNEITKRGVRRHTKSRGIPYLLPILGLPKHTIRCFVEPAICLVAAGIFWKLDFHFMAMWLFTSSWSLMLVELMVVDIQKNWILDRLDNWIDRQADATTDEVWKAGEKPDVEALFKVSFGRYD